MTKKSPALLLPANFNLDGAYALQRLMNDPDHKTAMDFLVNNLTGTYNDTFDVDQRIEARLQGRRSVGLDIITIYKLDLAKVKEVLSKEKK